MPEPLLYLQAIVAAAIVSAIFVMAVGARRGQTWLNTACVGGIGLGLLIGFYLLSLNVRWPPASALDRLLTIVIPAALVFEWIGGFQSVPKALVWVLRIGLAMTTPRILLHASVYLSGRDEWTLWQAAVAIAICGLLLTGVWSLLSLLSQRSGGLSIPLALCLTIQCAGMTVMMAGYIKGGAAAYLIAATLIGTTLAAWLITKRGVKPGGDTAPTNFAAPAILGFGVVGLFGVLFIGRFFGRVSTGMAIAMLLAPLLCWATEMPPLRNRNRWLIGSLRLLLVAIPLVVVLAGAKREFDRDMWPLLGKGRTSASQFH